MDRHKDRKRERRGRRGEKKGRLGGGGGHAGVGCGCQQVSGRKGRGREGEGEMGDTDHHPSPNMDCWNVTSQYPTPVGWVGCWGNRFP